MANQETEEATLEQTATSGAEDLPGGEDLELLNRREDSDKNRQRRAVFSVPIEITVCVGKAHPLIGDLLKMRRDALLPLDSRVEDLVEIRVANRVIARGELQELDDGSSRLGVRLTEIVDVNETL